MLSIVKSGEELLEISKSEPPDLIVTDINLKGKINGMEAAKIIISELDIPVLFLTGIDDNSLRAEAKKISSCEIVTKPFNPGTLNNAIKKCLNLL